MNVLVVGLGSMGKRRIRLIKKNANNVNIAGIDSDPIRRKECEERFGIETFDAIANVKYKIDSVFVCTSPLSHANIITECLNNGWHIFSEINLVNDGYEKNIKLAKEKGKVLFLSSTPFYKKEMQKIKEIFSPVSKSNYIYHIGQYLPDWHPWESYNNYFVKDKRTNGCREIMAIEFPWLIDLFGNIDEFSVVKDKITNLDINYNDNYMIHFKHNNGNKGSIIIDVVSPKATRKLEIYSEDKYVSWDGTPESLYFFDRIAKKGTRFDLYMKVDHNDNYSDFVIENAYEEEIRAFFNCINGENVSLYSFEKDKNILNLIDKIEG